MTVPWAGQFPGVPSDREAFQNSKRTDVRCFVPGVIQESTGNHPARCHGERISETDGEFHV
jgi:hypothetical protein